MFSPYRDHFNKALMTHDVTSSKDVMNPGNLFVMAMVRTILRTKIEENRNIYLEYFDDNNSGDGFTVS